MKKIAGVTRSTRSDMPGDQAAGFAASARPRLQTFCARIKVAHEWETPCVLPAWKTVFLQCGDVANWTLIRTGEGSSTKR